VCRHVVVVALLAALTWVGQASARAPWTDHYTVRPGDSLTAIAQRYDVSFETLATANGLDWRKPLLIGVVLRVPPTSSQVNGWAGIYVVRPGDTLSGIALRSGTSLAQLVAVNRIDPARLLQIGVRLQVPTVASTLGLNHAAESDPYPHAAVGYDVSYPNCAVQVPAAHTFAVIGLNHGRPFTTNPCFADEWAAAQPPRSVYINTAYAPSLFRHITPDCRAAGNSQPLGPAARRAYTVGCSEAGAAIDLLGPSAPDAIWLDVEPSNTWSSQQGLNAAAINGIVDRLLSQTPHPAVGVYSNASFWRQIVGDWTSLSLPEWVATEAPDPPGCPASFAAGPVWLSQSTDGTLDVDTAC
jgi:LysM repeat protein